MLCFTLTVHCSHCTLCSTQYTTHGSVVSALFCILLDLIVILTSVLQLWVYAYFPRLEPVPETETPLVVPFSRRYDGRCTRRPRDTFSFFRRFFDTITPTEVRFAYSRFKFRFQAYISISVNNQLYFISGHLAAVGSATSGDTRSVCRRHRDLALPDFAGGPGLSGLVPGGAFSAPDPRVARADSPGSPSRAHEGYREVFCAADGGLHPRLGRGRL